MEALRHDTYDVAAWRRWQDERLETILRRAATLVPAYRELWRARDADLADLARPEALDRWPLLTKADLRDDPAPFVADDRRLRDLQVVRTSGTSGTPLVIYRDQEDTARHYAIYEARVRRWNGVSRHDEWAIMGGQLVVPFERRTPPFWIRSGPLNQLYLSNGHLEPDNIPAYAAQLRSTRPTHLVGYPSSMTLLARLAHEQGVALPGLRVAISNAEPLLDAQRSMLGMVFDCPVRNTYGMSEGVAAAAECDQGSLHLSPENGIVEIIGEDDRPVPPGTAGEIVATGLANESMILVRYRTGDRGVLSPDDCPCGRKAPVIERIEGRTSDMILTPDDRRIFWLNPVFADLPIREAQVVQRSRADLQVRVVPAPTWDEASETSLRQRLRQRVGDMVIDVDPVPEIERGPNGKFPPVVSLIDR